MTALRRITFSNGSHALCAVLTMLCVFCFQQARSQQDWNYTQYLFNIYDVNPAYAGNHEMPSLSIRQRVQWVGVDGAPQTSTIAYHSPAWNNRIGWGFRMHRESIGAREQWTFRPSFAYKVRLGQGRLSFALAPGIIRQSMDPSLINARDIEDPQLAEASWNATSFSISAAWMYSTLHWFIGMEFSHLNSPAIHWTDSSKGHYFIHGNVVGGYLLNIGQNDLLAFTALVRNTVQGKAQAEANVTWLWNNLLWIGGGYRFGIGPDFMVEWNITKKMRVGYSFDLPMNSLATYQGNSHELFIGWNFGNIKNSSIRYF